MKIASEPSMLGTLHNMLAIMEILADAHIMRCLFSSLHIQNKPQKYQNVAKNSEPRKLIIYTVNGLM